MHLQPCESCSSFLPPGKSRCPHCDRAAPRWQKWALVIGGSALSVTLAACYGSPCARSGSSCHVPTDFPCTDTALDKDGDGYCGRWDCDETNKDIHWDAVDAKGDGIDQNCDGVDGDANLPEPPTK